MPLSRSLRASAPSYTPSMRFALLGALSTTLALQVAAQDETLTEGPATVSPMSGDLRVWRGARRKLEAIAKPIQIDGSDRVGSPKGDPVVLMSDDDIVLSVKGVKVGDKTGLSLVRTKEGLVVKLEDGSLLVDAFEKPLTVETAGGKIVGKQAYFLVEVKDGVTRVTAIDGTLTFSNPAGEVKVETGQESSAKGGAAPSDPNTVTTTVATADFMPKAATPTNLLKNPGFEEDLSVGWGKPDPKGALAVDAQVFNSGKGSLRATITPQTTSWRKPPYVTELGILQPLKFTVGRRYLVRFYLRAVVRKGAVSGSYAVAGIDTGDPKKDDYWQTVKLADAWRMQRVILTANKAVGNFGVHALIDDAAYDATFWVDDCCVVELPPVK